MYLKDFLPVHQQKYADSDLFTRLRRAFCNWLFCDPILKEERKLELIHAKMLFDEFCEHMRQYDSGNERGDKE